MTQGSPARVLVRFSIPMMLNVMFQQLYTIVNSIIAGRFVGESALAAIGASDSATGLFLAIATGCNIGASVVISQLFGAKNNRDMKTAIHTSLISVEALGVLLTLVALLFGGQMLTLLKTPSDIFHTTLSYFRIYACGLPLLFLYNICTGIFTALGDSRTPLYFLILSSFCNILMALLFVGVLGLGVNGAAVAIVLSQALSATAVFTVLIRRVRRLECEGKPALFSRRMLGRLASLAIPSIFQQSIASIGNLMIQGTINSYGTAVMAGASAAFKVHSFSNNALNALSNGLSNFTAQNIGGGYEQRVRKAFRSSVWMAIGMALLFTLPYVIFAEPLVRAFISDPTVQAVQTGCTFLWLVAPTYAIVAVKLMIDSILRGSGCTYCFTATTFIDLLCRVILVQIFPKLIGSDGVPLGFTGIALSWPIGWLVGLLLGIVFYLSGVWRNKKITT